MEKFFFWNTHTGLELGIFEGQNAPEAYRNLLIDAGYDPGSKTHEEYFLEFVSKFLSDDPEIPEINCILVEEKYFVTQEKARVSDSIFMFDDLEYETLEDAQKCLQDLRENDPDEDCPVPYYLYKGFVTSSGRDGYHKTAYILEVL